MGSLVGNLSDLLGLSGARVVPPGVHGIAGNLAHLDFEGSTVSGVGHEVALAAADEDAVVAFAFVAGDEGLVVCPFEVGTGKHELSQVLHVEGAWHVEGFEEGVLGSAFGLVHALDVDLADRVLAIDVAGGACEDGPVCVAADVRRVPVGLHGVVESLGQRFV